MTDEPKPKTFRQWQVDQFVAAVPHLESVADLPTNAYRGDAAFVGDGLYVFTDGRWVAFSEEPIFEVG